MAYRSFRPSGFEARGVRKVTTGLHLETSITQSTDSIMMSDGPSPKCAVYSEVVDG